MESFRSNIKNRKAKIAIVGFGYIGICIGAVIAKKGFEVVGIDTNKDIVDMINNRICPIEEPGLDSIISDKSVNISASLDYSNIKDSDVIIITVGTPLGPDFRPNNDHIKSAVSSICDFLDEDQLIILKSTVPPKTTEYMVYDVIKSKKDFDKPLVAFCPERLAEGNALFEFENIPVVVGGVNEESSLLASIFWEEILGVDTIILENSRTAEMVKLADNLWIDLNIALANEIALLSDKLNIDSLEVIKAANTLPKGQYNVNILYPGIGVGGYCLTKDPWFVHSLGKDFGLNLQTPVASRTVNDLMPDYTFDLIKQQLSNQGKNLSESTIAVLGVSFKANTGDCRFTPTKPIIEKLVSSRCNLRICDPWISVNDATEIINFPLTETIEDCISNADCVAFFTGHDEFTAFPLEKVASICNDNAIIIDGRGIFDKDQIRKIKSLGLNYKGIGR